MSKIEIMEETIEENYSDGELIEQQILEYVKSCPTGDYYGILEQNLQWPVFYHLTHMREGILNWYDFKPGCDILEIGAGMGAITGLLCEKAGTVTSVELTLPRAKVIEERCKKYENLTILVGNFNRMEFSQKYDYITLIGVLEYAPGFTPGGNPADFLKKTRSLLKPDGKLLVAIENRFGLKYWCGAAEDHTGKSFSGINGYPDNPEVHTWSRSDLAELLAETGFEKQKFFYPLPDYKFPQVLYSDDYYPKDRLNGKVRQYYSDCGPVLATERNLYKDLFSNQTFPFMANSFFVECGQKDVELSNISAVMLTPERDVSQRVITRISCTNHTVEKLAANPEGRGHIEEIVNNQQWYKGNDLVPYTVSDEVISMPFLEGKTLDIVILRLILNGQIEEAESWIARFYERVKASSDNILQGERVILRHGFMDMIFQNCMEQDNVMRFFDQEWVEENVPADLILYRAIRVFYAEYPEAQTLFPLKQLLYRLHFTDEVINRYEESVLLFGQKILLQRANPLCILDYFHAEKGVVSPEKVENQATLYFNTGSGYNEEESIKLSFTGNHLNFRCNIPAGCMSVRFDPVDNRFCVLKNIYAACDKGLLTLRNVNGESYDFFELFQTTDPQMEITFQEAVQWVCIQADSFIFVEQLPLQLVSAFSQAKQTEASAEERNVVLEQQLVQIKAEYDAISNAACWKMIKPLRLLLDLLKRMPLFALFVGGMKYLKDNGLRYTWRLVKTKLRNRFVK